jgi:hypothetical protein
MLTKNAVKAVRAYEKATPDRDVARARVTEGHVTPGPYLALPLIGWLAQVGGARFLSLGMALIRISDNSPVGSLGWAIPFGPRTDETCANVLAALGWDGRIWPTNPGWPTGTDREEAIRTMLDEANLGNAIVFPPDETRGAPAVRINVLASSGPFTLDPSCVGAANVPESWKQRLWALVSDPAWFQR